MSKELLVAVIDDDKPLRTALAEALLSLGYGVRDFASAEEFLARGMEVAWDCVITDIHMSGMSGFDVKRLLLAGGSEVPVIMITARSEPGLEARAKAAGVVCLLTKPFESSALVDCLDRALSPD